MPKVSVVIPCYNQGAYLDETVDSVLAQSFDDYEIIVVNDGSTDAETNKKLAAYDKPKTRVIATANQGLAAARNNGIAAARGQYILPLDADDRIGEHYLRRAVEILDVNPGIGIVYCRAKLFGAVDSPWVLPEFSLDEMLIDNIIFCSGVFRRRDWEEVGGYDPAMVYGWEDYDFWLSLLERGRLVHKIPEILFHYRITADSMARSKSKEQKIEIFKRIFHKHRDFYSEHIDIWINKLIESRETYHTTRLYVDTGDGFNEQQRLTQKLDPRGNQLSFDLSGFRAVEQLRFCPINDYCVLHLNSVTLSTEDGREIELEPYQANTLEPASANLVFTDNDPYLLFRPAFIGEQRNRLKSLVVSYRLLAIGDEAFSYILKRKDEELARQREVIRQLEQGGAAAGAGGPAGPAAQITPNMSTKQLAKFMARKALFFLKTIKYRCNARYRAVRDSGLFDADYYLSEYADLRGAVFDPLMHYLEHGNGEGRNPNPLFATTWYKQAYPDVHHAGINTLYHYISQGWSEGRNPCPMFETEYYLRENPEVAASGMNPLRHYLEIGGFAGKKPNPLFDSAYYLEQYPEVAEAKLNPLVHYARLGFYEGRATHRHLEKLQYNPKISILTPVYNVDEPYLRQCIESVRNQVYENWQLCLADDCSTKAHVREVLAEYEQLDPRIKVVFLPKNQGIAGATNAAADLADGDYVAFLDNDDELTRDALLEVARCINEQGADIVYSDECFIDINGKFLDAHHKPDFSGDLLLSHNYITHFTVMKKEIFARAGRLSKECDGAQDYDLILRATELTDNIAHIPKILYRWRTLETSTAADPESKSYADRAGMLALENALRRREVKGRVFYGNLRFYYRVKRALDSRPLVTIIIPFCDQPDYLSRCVNAILDKTSYQNYEILGINNNSKQEATFALMRELETRDARIKFLDYNEPFNYSRINNFGVEHARGEHLVLMNNDIKVLGRDWLEALLEHSARPGVGAVGAKLYYGDDTIQHAGVIVGIGGFAGHSHRHLPRTSAGYFNRLCCIQNVSAVTAALLMVKKSLYEQVGGLDADNLGVALNDVDFCLKLRDKGYLNVFTPYCEAYHYESVSRGYEDSPEKKERFAREVAFFKEKWADLLKNGDPYYNVNLSLDREDFSRRKYQQWYVSEESRRQLLLPGEGN